MTGPEVRSRLYAAKGPGARPVSVKTVRNRIHAGGFKSMVPAKKAELTRAIKMLVSLSAAPMQDGTTLSGEV